MLLGRLGKVSEKGVNYLDLQQNAPMRGLL